jgi:RsiW-degrading membrane proteinase PrsW (M82 family)
MAITVRVVGNGDPVPPQVFEGPVVRVGREKGNDLVLTGPGTGTVSRHHVELRWADGQWRVVDGGSTHGTYLRGQRVTDAVLRNGDEIQLASDGPRLVVSLTTPAVAGQTSAGTSAGTGVSRGPSESELLPLRMGSAPVAARGYLVPGLLTAGSLSAVLWAFSSNDLKMALTVMFFFFTAASIYVLYMLCGKPKSPWVLVAAALAVGLLVQGAHHVVVAPIRAVVLPYIGKEVPGPRPGTVRIEAPDHVPGRFVYHLFLAALPEELEKILPALFGLYLAARVRRRGSSSPLESDARVVEPLDGILLGVAGAAGFNFVESLSYAQQPLAKLAELKQQAAPLLAKLAQEVGLQNAAATLLHVGFNTGTEVLLQVFLRGVGDVFGHQAYSGIFGYYVGLAAMRPQHARSLFVRGLLTAILLHAAWNATAGVGGSVVLPAISFAFLVTCIIKARALSPARAQNFATVIVSR